MFSATVKAGTWTSPGTPGRCRAAGRRAGERIVDGVAVEADLAGVGAGEAVDDLHQRALAGAVLADERVHLARVDVEVDAIVRATPPGNVLRDPAEGRAGDPLMARGSIAEAPEDHHRHKVSRATAASSIMTPAART